MALAALNRILSNSLRIGAQERGRKERGRSRCGIAFSCDADSSSVPLPLLLLLLLLSPVFSLSLVHIGNWSWVVINKRGEIERKKRVSEGGKKQELHFRRNLFSSFSSFSSSWKKECSAHTHTVCQLTSISSLHYPPLFFPFPFTDNCSVPFFIFFLFIFPGRTCSFVVCTIALQAVCCLILVPVYEG